MSIESQRMDLEIIAFLRSSEDIGNPSGFYRP
jgi:hypothetical protein